MKRKILILVICIFFVAGGLAVAAYNTSAQDKSLRDLLRFDPETTTVVGTEVSDYSGVVPITVQQQNANEEIIKEAQDLIVKAESVYLVAGWLHRSSETEAFVTAQKTLPDGTPIPTKWTDDSWYLLDDKGKVIKAVSIQDTGNAVTSQISVYQNGMWTNLSLGSTFADESFTLMLGSDFISTALKYSTIDALSKEETTIQGKDVVVLVMAENYVDPISFGKDDGEKYIGGGTKYYFDRNSGLELQSENFYIRNDGTYEVFQRISNMKIEKAEQIPDSLAGYFDTK